MTDTNHGWQREVSERLGRIEAKLEPLAEVEKRLRALEGAQQLQRGALAVVAFMGVTSIIAFLGWLARLAGLLH